MKIWVSKTNKGKVLHITGRLFWQFSLDIVLDSKKGRKVNPPKAPPAV